MDRFISYSNEKLDRDIYEDQCKYEDECIRDFLRQIEDQPKECVRTFSNVLESWRATVALGLRCDTFRVQIVDGKRRYIRKIETYYQTRDEELKDIAVVLKSMSDFSEGYRRLRPNKQFEIANEIGKRNGAVEFRGAMKSIHAYASTMPKANELVSELPRGDRTTYATRDLAESLVLQFLSTCQLLDAIKQITLSTKERKKVAASYCNCGYSLFVGMAPKPSGKGSIHGHFEKCYQTNKGRIPKRL